MKNKLSYLLGTTMRFFKRTIKRFGTMILDFGGLIVNLFT